MACDQRAARRWLACGLVLAGGLLSAVPLSAQATPPPGIAAEALSDYVIGPGDLLQIDIFELEELSKTVRVTGEGVITYPMLGAVEVSGLTKRALETRLARLLSERYVRDPQVTVFIEEMQSGKVSVLGAVQQPGGFGLIGAKTILDVLSQAGGVSRDAGTRAFLIRASNPEPVAIDLKRLLEEADLKLNLAVAPGDVVYVPKARFNKVYVYGQVEKPGVFDVEEGERVTVLQAVSMAGGLSRRSAAGKTKIVRGGVGGKRVVVPVDLSQVLAGRAADPLLEPGDIVVVPRSFF
jgi:polysaccharide export outer membrane protein